MTINHCEGCLTTTSKTTYCTFIFYNNEGQCPCSKCIVKMMCERACYRFMTFKMGVRGRKDDERLL